MAVLRLNLLGGFELRSAAGETVTLSARKPAVLLAYLALRGEQAHGRDKLAGLLWADRPESQARSSLRQALAVLRKALPDGSSAIFTSDGDSLGLVPGTVTSDVAEFEAAVADGSACPPDTVLALYRGDLLDGLYIDSPPFEEWLIGERQRLRELALVALNRLLADALDTGATETGIRIAMRLLSLDPLQESVHRALMQLYARQGRHGAALRQYQTCRAILQQEVGVLPEPETERVLREIREQRRRGAGPAPTTAPACAEPSAAPFDEPKAARSADLTPQLRHVAILFADLSGFTQLCQELDPEDIHNLLSHLFETTDSEIERFGGTVDKHIGDAVMAVFGLPKAHGNDAERAIRAAFAIHAAMPRVGAAFGRHFAVHIGIACGQVFVSGLPGNGGKATLMGEAVNLAARITDLAGPGETVIDDSVRRALDGRLNAEPRGDVTVKGFGAPVGLWRVQGLADRAAVQRPPLVGRRVELHQFAALLQACADTGSGAVVQVRGEPGIGKTRLVEEFQRMAAERGFACHTGLVLDFGMGKAQGAIRSIVRSLAGVPAGGGEADVRAAAERLFADGILDPDRRVHLYDLLSLTQPADLRGRLDAMPHEARDRGKRDTVVELVCAMGARRLLLVTVEDIHWADDRTLACLASLAAAVPDCAAVLVMTSRSQGTATDKVWRGLSGVGPTLTIDLWPLRPAEAIRLAGHYLPADDPALRTCVERAGGNPLFLEQLLRHAREKAPDEIPGSIQSIVLARLDVLDPADRWALQAASVLGQRFALPALRHLIDDPDYDAVGLAEQALARPSGEDWLFAHALVQEAVYGSLPRSRRRDLHRRAAVWFAERDAALHAEHLERAGDPGALPAYLKAIGSEAGDYRFERARTLAEQALKLDGERADRFALVCQYGDILQALGENSRSREAFEQALEIAADDAERCRGWLGLAGVMRVTDDLAGALAALDKADSAAIRAGLIAERAQIHHLRGNLFFPMGRLEGCQREHEAALELARQTGSIELEASALSGLGDAFYATGRMRTADKHFRRCIALCRVHGLTRIEVTNLYMAAGSRLYLNDLRGALDEIYEALRMADETGHRRAELVALALAVQLLYDLGDLAASRTHALRMLDLARQLGSARFEAASLMELARGERIEGRRAEACRLIEQALAICRESVRGFTGPWILAQYALTLEDPAARRKALAQGEELLAAGSISHNHLQFHRIAIETMLDMGDWDMADRYATALEEYTRPEPLPWSTLIAARGRMLARHGRGDRSPAVLSELERMLEECRAIGFMRPMPRIEAALAAAGPVPVRRGQ